MTFFGDIHMFDLNQPAYQAFRNILTERTNRTIAWIGSGLGVPAGLPVWRGLKEQLCDTFAKKIASMEEREQKEFRDQLQAATKESNFWLAFHLLKKGLGPTTYRVAIREALRGAE